MRHGDAVGGMCDETRPLSEKGRQEAAWAGDFLKRAGEIPELIFHSTLLRSRQTAEEIAQVLEMPDRLCACSGLCPGDSPQRFAADVVGDLRQRILVVGHLPFVETLTSLLVSNAETTVGLRFTTGSVLGLERASLARCWTIRFFAPAKLISCLQETFPNASR